MRRADIFVLIFGLLIIYLVYRGLPASVLGDDTTAVQFNYCRWSDTGVTIVGSKTWPSVSFRRPYYEVYAGTNSCNINYGKAAKVMSNVIYSFYDIQGCEPSIQRFQRHGITEYFPDQYCPNIDSTDKSLLQSYGWEWCDHCIDYYQGGWKKDLPGFRIRGKEDYKIFDEIFKYSKCIGHLRIRYRLHGQERFLNVEVTNGTPVLYSQLIACKFSTKELKEKVNEEYRQETGHEWSDSDVQLFYPMDVQITFATEKPSPPTTTTTTTIPVTTTILQSQPELSVWDKITSFVDSILSFFKGIFL